MTAQTTSTRSTARRARTGPASNSQSVGPILIAVAVLAAGVLAAIIIAFATGDDTTSVSAGNPAAHLPATPSDQVASVQLAGDPLPAFDATVGDWAVGMRPPEIAASFFDGASTTVTPGDGVPKILLFLAHWCPHCQAEVSSLTDWFATNGVPADVEIIAVSTSVDSGAPNYPPSSWLLEEDWPTPVLRDSARSEVAEAYGLTGFPFIVALDAEGTVVSRASGGLPTAEWEALLDVLSAS